MLPHPCITNKISGQVFAQGLRLVAESRDRGIGLLDLDGDEDGMRGSDLREDTKVQLQRPSR